MIGYPPAGNCKGINSAQYLARTAEISPAPAVSVRLSILRHRCTTLAFSPLRSAIAATDAPLWRQA